MRDWTKIGKDAILKGKDENGNRYLSQFLKDYQELTGAKNLNAGCGKCLNDYYKKYLKMKNQKKSGYVLKSKYDGIPLNFGSRTFVSNRNMTDKLAKELIKNHPKGKGLFDKVPESGDVKETDLNSLKRGELDVIATDLELKPGDYSNKADLIEAIESAQQKQ